MVALSQDQLNQIVADEVAKAQKSGLMDPGHKNAIIFAQNGPDSQVIITGQLGHSGWRATGYADHNWKTGDNSIGGGLAKSW